MGQPVLMMKPVVTETVVRLTNAVMVEHVWISVQIRANVIGTTQEVPPTMRNVKVLIPLIEDVLISLRGNYVAITSLWKN